MCKDFIPIEHFWFMQMLGNFGTKLLFLCFLPPPCPKIVPAPLNGADIYRHKNKFSIEKIAILCFIMNVIIARQKCLALLIYLFFSKFSYR